MVFTYLILFIFLYITPVKWPIAILCSTATVNSRVRQGFKIWCGAEGNKPFPTSSKQSCQLRKRWSAWGNDPPQAVAARDIPSVRHRETFFLYLLATLPRGRVFLRIGKFKLFCVLDTLHGTVRWQWSCAAVHSEVQRRLTSP